MIKATGSIGKSIQDYVLHKEQGMLDNITFEVDLLQGMTSGALRLTIFLTLLTLAFFNPYTLGVSSVVAILASVSGYVCYTVYGMGKKESGYPHFEATHMIGLLFAFPFMLIIAWICGTVAYYGVEFMGLAVFGQ
jgi:hypothetical protein